MSERHNADAEGDGEARDILKGKGEQRQSAALGRKEKGKTPPFLFQQRATAAA